MEWPLPRIDALFFEFGRSQVVKTHRNDLFEQFLGDSPDSNPRFRNEEEPNELIGRVRLDCARKATLELLNQHRT